MDVKDFILIHTKPDQIINELAAKETDKRMVLLHTVAISLLLNLGVGIVFFDVFLTTFYTIILTLTTVIAIPLIEYATFFAAKSKSGKEAYWKQLDVTNHYLTGIFFVFFVFLAVFSWITPDNLRLGLDAIAFALVLRVNDKKIKILHGMDKALVPNIVYGVTTAAAYVIWLLVLFIPVLLALLVGVPV